MSINLIESEHGTQKSLGGTFVSIAVHACVITLAVYATASAGEIVVRVPIDTVHIVYTSPPKDPGTSHAPVMRAPHEKPTLPATPLRRIVFSTTIPNELPDVNTAAPVIDAGTVFGAPTSGDGGAPGTGLSGDSGEPLFAAQVEKPATARNGNPSPKYPSLLESSRVEGVVLVQFVVDTLGVADMSTFKVLEASNDLFAESTRASLAKWRFYSAEVGGRKVKQIVQLPLRFVAPHH